MSNRARKLGLSAEVGVNPPGRAQFAITASQPSTRISARAAVWLRSHLHAYVAARRTARIRTDALIAVAHNFAPDLSRRAGNEVRQQLSIAFLDGPRYRHGNPLHLVTGRSTARRRGLFGCERRVLQIQDAQHLVRCLRAADRPGVRYSAPGGCGPRDASMQIEAVSIVLRSLPILWSCALSHDRPEFFASPSRTG